MFLRESFQVYDIPDPGETWNGNQAWDPKNMKSPSIFLHLSGDKFLEISIDFPFFLFGFLIFLLKILHFTASPCHVSIFETKVKKYRWLSRQGPRNHQGITFALGIPGVSLHRCWCQVSGDGNPKFCQVLPSRKFRNLTSNFTEQ